MAESIKYIYQIIDRFTPALKKIAAANKNFAEGVKTASKKMAAGVDIDKVKNTITGFSVATGAGLVVASKRAMDFESVMTDVGKVMNLNANDPAMIKFKENILKTSVAMGKIPKNVAEIAVAGGKLGIAMKDMDNFIGIVSRTSVAFDMVESNAGEQLASIQAKLGLTIDETGRLMDAVNYLADNTAAGGSRMIEIVARTSGTFKLLKMPKKFIAGWAAFADQMEVTPELAASGLNMMVARMREIPGMLEKMVKSPQQAISGLLESLAGLDAVTRAKQIDKLFGENAGRFVMKAVESMQKYKDTMALVNDETSFANSMMAELTRKLGTSETAWGQIKAIADVVAITIGDVLTPYIKAAAPRIVELGFSFRRFANLHPDILKLGVAMGVLAAAIAPLLLIISVVGLPIILIGAAIVAVGGYIFYVYQNFKKLKEEFLGFFDDIKRAYEWISGNIKKGLTPEQKKQFEVKTNFTGAASSFWEQLKSDFGFGEKGVAAKNTTAKTTIEGNITVSATPGSKVESAGMQTSAPGNLGFNMMGVTP